MGSGRRDQKRPPRARDRGGRPPDRSGLAPRKPVKPTGDGPRTEDERPRANDGRPGAKSRRPTKDQGRKADERRRTEGRGPRAEDQGPRAEDRRRTSGDGGPRLPSVLRPPSSVLSGELLFGRNAVLEALRAGRPIRRLMLAASAHGDAIADVADAARARGVPVQTVQRVALDALANHHQGVVAQAAPFRYASLEDVLTAARASESPPLVLVLDTLQDPQNFGALLRTAAAVGAHGAVIPEHRAVGVTPLVTKTSAGATAHIPIAQVGNLVHALRALKEAGLWVVGLDIRAEQPHVEVDLSGPLAIVVGGEDRGVRPLVRQACDFLVRLPMPGPIESLNAAVAGSVVLYEVLRQRALAAETAAAPD